MSQRDKSKSTNQQTQQVNKELQGKLKLYNELIDQLIPILYEQLSSENQSNTYSQSIRSNNRLTPFNSKLKQTNLRQLFDLLVYFDKKQPQLLQTIMEIGLIQKLVDKLSPQEMIDNVKLFILIIANCSTNGIIMTHIIQNGIIDQILIKYLSSIQFTKQNNGKTNNYYNHNQHKQQYEQDKDNQEEGGIQYLGSLLKASSMHINSNTWKWFCGRGMLNTNNPYINHTEPPIIQNHQISIFNQSSKNVKKVQEDPFDIFNAVINGDLDLQHQQKSQQITSLHQHQQYFTTVKNREPLTNTSSQKKYECLLLKICTKFHNCPQQLTRTTVINIVMRILKQPYARQLISDPLTMKTHQYINQWSQNMCCGLKNELKNFSQRLMVIQPTQLEMYIQQLNDIIILWEDLTQTPLATIYQQQFLHIVIYSLFIGSLNTSSLPMFNINFTFYIIAKLVTVFHHLDLINTIAQLLFMKSVITYEQKWVTTAMLKRFDLFTLLTNDEGQQEKKERLEYSEKIRQRLSKQGQKQEKLKFEGVNEFFLSMLKSKDENFLFIAANLLYEILACIRKNLNNHKNNQNNNNKNAIEYHQLLSTMGLNNHGYLFTKLTSILISQLRHDHPLSTLKRILQIIIFIHPHPHPKFNQDNSNQFVFFYKEVLIETLQMIENGQKYSPYIVQTFQYDMRLIEASVLKCKGWKDQQLLKQNPLNDQQLPQMKQKNTSNHTQKYQVSKKPNRSFSTAIPQTPSHILRYKIAKTFLLLKFNELMIQNKQTQQILTNYVQKLRLWQQKQPKSGDKLLYPLKQKFHQCKLIEEKTQIPCVLIEDDVNLIIGFVEANFAKVIANIKLKHVYPEIFTRKDKTYIKLNVNKFDYVCQNIVHKSTLLIRGFNTGIQYFAVKKENFKEKEINSIKKGLKKTIENLPDISLL